MIEAALAVSVLAAGVAGLAQVALLTGRSNGAAHRLTVAQQAARERLEQLRSLSWTSDGSVPVTDWSSNLATSPQSSGGFGLTSASDATLAANTAGYSDFLDADGRWLSSGPNAPHGAAWARRWSITSLGALPDTLVFQVVVMPATSAFDGGLAAARSGNGAWLMAMHTRRAR